MGNIKKIIKNKKGHRVECKKHPKHKQSPGVCSICLIEKLSDLYHNNSSSLSTRRTSLSSLSSSSSSLSSYSSSSSCSSPAPGVSKKMNNINVFGKSRSMAFLGRMRPERVNNGGFFGKLFRARPRSQKSVAS